MFGPTGWVFLGALLAGFAALLYWLVRARWLASQIIAGVTALAVSTLFGASLVNQSYAYYTTWGSLFDAATGSGVSAYQTALAPRPGRHVDHGPHDPPPPITAPPAPTLTPAPASTVPASVVIAPIGLHAARATGGGRVVRLDLPGALSGITRTGYVYLPPQYFQPAYATTSFPVIELLHGDPGNPAGWLYGLHLPDVMDHGIDAGTIGPMVVVMPATFTGKHGQDCVDAPGGQLDDTYLSADVPADVAHDFRVLPQGLHWGIGGLSDGGFCAANLALRHPGRYGAVASMDGFYSVFADLGVLGKIFGQDSIGLRANDPSTLAGDTGHALPRFWLMSGTADATDTKAMTYFREILTAREPVASVIVRGGSHTPPAWRVVLPSLLAWTWNTISGGPVSTTTTTFILSAQTRSSPPAASSTSPKRDTSTPSPHHSSSVGSATATPTT